jgi:hypothetical protein
VSARSDFRPPTVIARSLLEQVATVAADDLALSDEASGSTFLGPEGLLLWLQAGAGESRGDAARNGIRFAEIAEFRDGKIARMRAFRNTTEFLRDSGLTSPAVSSPTVP